MHTALKSLKSLKSRTPLQRKPRKPRSLALALVEALVKRIRDGRVQAGDKLPTEAAIMGEFGVSRTVVREALSKLQAAGQVATRHGVGSFVVGVGDAAPFRVAPEQFATLQDVIAVLELRIGLETEAASLAAQRRTAENLRALRRTLNAFASALAAGQDAVTADFQFHCEIARATQNHHFGELMDALGTMIIPRARLGRATPDGPDRAARSARTPETRADDGPEYLRRVLAEHESIFDAIRQQDPDAARAAMRTHLANSRERRRRLVVR